MSTRFAIRVTPELLSMASSLTGSDSEVFETLDQTQLFMIIEPLSPAKFILEIKSEDEVLEEFKTDPNIEIVY